MSNRNERDYSSDDFGRRDDRDGQLGHRHPDEDREYGQRSDARSGRFSEGRSDENRFSEGRSGEGRFGEGRFGEGSARFNRGPEYRSQNTNEQRYAGVNRDEHRDSSYYPYSNNASRDSGQGGQYSQNTGRYQDRGQDRYNQDRYNQSGSSGSARGVYQEQVWTRDPSSGNLYGYEYTTRLPASRGASSGYEGGYSRDVDRWRNDNDSARQNWSGSSRNGDSPEARRNAGNYGKGPKGYTRSDERIREDVSDRLSDDDQVDASEITVTVTNGEVRLEGHVIDRHSKHRAEDIAEAVSGVRDVSNHLRTKKGFFQELGDKLSGDEDNAHRGHAGSGTRNSPSGTAPKSNVAATAGSPNNTGIAGR